MRTASAVCAPSFQDREPLANNIFSFLILVIMTIRRINITNSIVPNNSNIIIIKMS